MAKNNYGKKDQTKRATNKRSTGRNSARNTRDFREDPAELARPSSVRGNERVSVNQEHWNDPSWYITDQTTAEAVATIPFGRPLGYPVGMGRGAATDDALGEAFLKDAPLPGIVALKFFPTIGDSNSASSPINMAGVSLYTTTRGKNSGYANYASADMVMMLTAMDSLYMMYSIGERLYGTLRTFSPTNAYLPRRLIEAQGWDFDNVSKQVANIKGFLDLFRARLGGIAVPAHLTYFTRHYKLCGSVFKDAEILKSSLIVPVPHFVWKYSGYSDQKGGELVRQDWYGDDTTCFHTFEEYQDIVNSMLDAVVSDPDIGIISGDIVKRYEGSLYGIEPLSWDYTVEPVYDNWMLVQIHNATLNADPVSVSIKQVHPENPNESSYVKAEYICKHGAPYLGKILLDADVDQPSPEYVMEMTRFANSARETPDGNHYVECVGSEIATAAVVVRYDPTNNNTLRILAHSYLAFNARNNAIDAVRYAILALSLIDTVDYFPMIWAVSNSADRPEYLYGGTFGIRHNPTNVTGEQLRAMNNMAFMKMLFGNDKHVGHSE